MSSPLDLTSMAAPGSEEELIALVQEAAGSGRAVVSYGRGTKRHHGPAAPATAQALTLRRLDRVTGHEPGDMVVSAQAGVRLSDLQQALARHGQWLPIDPPYAEATIGGVLATHSNGPRRLGYGTGRDLLLGLRVLSSGGRVTRSGGRVVKNVTGYDLHKVHVGAFGSLGILLEAHLKVRPLPEESGVALLACQDFATAHELLLEVWGSPLRPVALEALSPTAATAIPALASEQRGALALVGIESSRSVFDRHVRTLEGLRAARALRVLRGIGAQALWTALRDSADKTREQVIVRFGARPHDLPDLLRAAAPEGQADLTAQVGTGVARLRLSPSLGGAEIARRVEVWHAEAARKGGYALVEAAPLDLPGREALPWGRGSSGLDAALKRSLDPPGLMNPGRMAW